MSEVAIHVDHISKAYGPVKALDNVSFTVGKGEVFGLIGPDGAGKTLLFRIMATLLLPDAGSVTVDGYDTMRQMKAIRRRTGYMPGRFSLYQDLTVEESDALAAPHLVQVGRGGHDRDVLIFEGADQFP